MSELYSDTSRFARDLDAFLTRDDRPECDFEDVESDLSAESEATAACDRASALVAQAAFDTAWVRLTQAQEREDWQFVSLLRARDDAGAHFEPPYWIARIESGQMTWQSENANPGRAVTDVLGMAGVVESVCGEQRGEVGLS